MLHATQRNVNTLMRDQCIIYLSDIIGSWWDIYDVIEANRIPGNQIQWKNEN